MFVNASTWEAWPHPLFPPAADQPVYVRSCTRCHFAYVQPPPSPLQSTPFYSLGLRVVRPLGSICPSTHVPGQAGLGGFTLEIRDGLQGLDEQDALHVKYSVSSHRVES